MTETVTLRILHFFATFPFEASGSTELQHSHTPSSTILEFLCISPAIPIREQPFVGSRLLSKLLSSKLHFLFDAGQGFRIQRNELPLSTLPDHSKRTTIKIDVSDVCPFESLLAGNPS